MFDINRFFERDKVVWWAVVGLVVTVVLVWVAVGSLPDDNLRLVACDVGQGDAILVQWKARQVLVDGGPSSRVLDCLSRYVPFWDRTIEVVVLTHAQDDHMNGLVEVLERYEVENILLSGALGEAKSFGEFREAVVEEAAKVRLVKQGDLVRIGPLLLEVKWPKTSYGSEIVWESLSDDNVLGVNAFSGDLNKTSVVLELSFGSFEALLTGDIGQAEERALVGEGLLSGVEVLKVAHHGSKYSSSSEFLREISPDLALISVGGRNSYGHPTSDTLMGLDTVGAKVLRTDEVGDVEIVSDGKNFWVVGD